MSYCASCKNEGESIWKGQIAYCSFCGRSFKETADLCEKMGLSSAGHYEYCFNCLENKRWDDRAEILVCTGCGLSKLEADKVEEERPARLDLYEAYNSGSLGQILTVNLDNANLPIRIVVSWSKINEGYETSDTFLGTAHIIIGEKIPNDIATNYNQAIEVIEGQQEVTVKLPCPPGAKFVTVKDLTGQSKRLQLELGLGAIKISKIALFFKRVFKSKK